MNKMENLKAAIREYWLPAIRQNHTKLDVEFEELISGNLKCTFTTKWEATSIIPVEVLDMSLEEIIDLQRITFKVIENDLKIYLGKPI